jgi:dTDP-4-amino-4,6-dideoxygalactose transaminase
MQEIPMLDLRREYEYMKSEIDSALHKCLDHQKWIFGPEIKEFEDSISKYIGVTNCIGVSSGTEALVLSLRALAIKIKGEEYFSKVDEVITTPFTFTATGDAILRSGATPVFIDIDPVTYNIDANKIEEYLTTSVKSGSSKVRGILPVHLYGRASNMTDIMRLADEYNLFVLEDVAQAFGATWKRKRLGAIGNSGAFSFFPSKNLGSFGDAGLVTTNDDGIAKLVRNLLKHGGKDKYNVDHIGYNGRLDTLQAAILLAKLKYIDEFNEKRNKIAKIYSRGLKALERLSLPVESDDPLLFWSPSKMRDSCHVFHQYTVRTSMREELRTFLRKKGVSTMIYYPFPLHKMKVFQGRMKRVGNLENAEKAAQEVLSLPIEPLQQNHETDYVVDCIKQFFR